MQIKYNNYFIQKQIFKNRLENPKVYFKIANTIIFDKEINPLSIKYEFNSKCFILKDICVLFHFSNLNENFITIKYERFRIKKPKKIRFQRKIESKNDNFNHIIRKTDRLLIDYYLNKIKNKYT